MVNKKSCQAFFQNYEFEYVYADTNALMLLSVVLYPRSWSTPYSFARNTSGSVGDRDGSVSPSCATHCGYGSPRHSPAKTLYRSARSFCFELRLLLKPSWFRVFRMLATLSLLSLLSISVDSADQAECFNVVSSQCIDVPQTGLCNKV